MRFHIVGLETEYGEKFEGCFLELKKAIARRNELLEKNPGALYRIETVWTCLHRK